VPPHPPRLCGRRLVCRCAAWCALERRLSEDCSFLGGGAAAGGSRPLGNRGAAPAPGEEGCELEVVGVGRARAVWVLLCGGGDASGRRWRERRSRAAPRGGLHFFFFILE
jgi:hypothetical protein